MGNGHHGALTGQILNGLLDLLFRLHIHGSSRFIQNDDG